MLGSIEMEVKFNARVKKLSVKSFYSGVGYDEHTGQPYREHDPRSATKTEIIKGVTLILNKLLDEWGFEDG